MGLLWFTEPETDEKRTGKTLFRRNKKLKGWSVEKTNEKAQDLSIGTLNLAC
jgi:hypothetical protein